MSKIATGTGAKVPLAGAALRVDGLTGVRRRPTTDMLSATVAIAAPRPAREGLAMMPFDVRVDARENERDERREDRAPEREEDETQTSDKAAAHGSGGHAGLNDRERVQRARH
jgi:hypothetical protein